MPTHISRIANNKNQDKVEEYTHPDFKKLIVCLKIFGAALCIAAVLYGFTRDTSIVVSILGASFGILTLFHPAFGLIFLFAFLSLENAFVFRLDFTYSKLIGIIVFISYLLHFLRLRFVFSAPQKISLLILAWSWFGWFWCLNPAHTKTQLTTFSLYFGMAFIGLNVLRDKKSFFIVLGGFVLGAVIVSLMLVAGQVEYETWSARELGRAALTEEGSPVILGRAIAFGFILACLGLFSKNKLLKTIIIGILLLFFVAMVTKTQSRMAMIVACVAPASAYILFPGAGKRRKRLFTAGFVICLAALSIIFITKSGLMSERGVERFSSQGLEESGRIRMWEQGLRVFKERPFHGYGYNNVIFAREKYGQSKISLHNNILAILVEEGLIGLALYVVLIGVLYKQTKKIPDPKLYFLGISMLVYACLAGLTSVNYGKKDFWYALMITMIVISLSSSNSKKKPILTKK